MVDRDEPEPGAPDLASAIGRARPPDGDLAVEAALHKARRAVLGIDDGAPQVGRFVILSQLGSGAMGDVFEAYDPKLDRKIALKVVRGEGEETRRRFLREARALARLSHPNVVAVHDAKDEGGRLCIVMELVQGKTLRAYLAEPRPWREIARVFADCARGLLATHRAGLVHGDFKPDNVLVGDDGAARVADFGLARVGEQGLGELAAGAPGAPASSTTCVGGTPAYMAPELEPEHPATARSDQFSFCVSLYEAVTGARPFERRARPRAADPPARRGVPTAVARAIRRGLRKDPDARWPDMTSLLAVLDDAARGRRRGQVAVAAVAFAVTGAATFAAFPHHTPPCQEGPAQFAAAWSPYRKLALLAHWRASSAA